MFLRSILERCILEALRRRVLYCGHSTQYSHLVHVLYTQKVEYNHIYYLKILEIWANAQRVGRPAEYSRLPLFNAAVWLTPTSRVPCSNAAKTWNPLKFAAMPQTNEMISAAIVGRGSSYSKCMWGRYCCLTTFFRLSIHALVAKI